MSTNQLTGFFDELRQRRRDLARIVGPGAGLTLVAFLIAFYFIEPPPPDSIAIAAGSHDGRYFAFASTYAKEFEQHKVTLDVRATAGTVDNFALLAEDNGVNLAIVQGGVPPADPALQDNLEALATLYFEPLWVFHRADLAVTDLADLAGRKISVGAPGSGSFSLATQLLEANGVEDGLAGTELVQLSVSAAADALIDSSIDVAMFVLGPDAPLIGTLLEDPELALMDFERQDAYSRRFPFLKSVVLKEGVINFERNLPADDVRLVAPGAMLVATHDLHEAFVPLLMHAVLQQHQHNGFLSNVGELPTLDYVSFPVNATARNYVQHGPTIFQRHLSFWIASLLDRTKILIIPMLTLLIPLVKMAPPIYRWRIRSRIYRWYGVLRQIDQQLKEGSTADVQQFATTLDAMSRELDSVDVPLSYMEEFYNLRLHIDLVASEVRRSSDTAATAPDSAAPRQDASAADSTASDAAEPPSA